MSGLGYLCLLDVVFWPAILEVIPWGWVVFTVMTIAIAVGIVRSILRGIERDRQEKK